MLHTATRPGRLLSLLAGVLLATAAMATMTPGRTNAAGAGCGAPTSLAVAANQNGRLELFGVCAGRVVHRVQLSGNTGWSTWQQLGRLTLARGDYVQNLIVAPNADGRLEVFLQTWGVVVGEGSLQHIRQASPNGRWAAWDTMPSPGYSLDSVVRNADGRLELFGKTLAAAVVHAWQLRPSGSWSSWVPLGGAVMYGYVSAGRNADGRLEVFAQGADSVGTVWHAWQLASGGWSPWASLGNPSPGEFYRIWGGTPVVNNADGRLEIIVGGDNYWGCTWSYHAWQLSTGGWSGWTYLSQTCGAAPVVGINANGRLEVFRQPGPLDHLDSSPPGPVWRQWQLVPNGGWTATEAPMQGSPNATGWVVVARDGKGLLEAFVPVRNAIWHASQVKPNGGWSTWRALP